MLKALYDFKATFSKTLSFKENDFFILHQTNTKQRNWWQVINEKGEIGFVPSNYVETISVSPSFMLQFLDDCIITLQNEKTNSTALDRQELLLRLRERRRHTEINIKGLKKPETSNMSSSTISNDECSTSQTKEIRSTIISSSSSESSRIIPDLKYGSPSRKESEISVRKISSSNSVNHSLEKANNDEFTRDEAVNTVEIKPEDVYELVENVRINTNLSHELSLVAVNSVITFLQEVLPSNVKPQLSQILSLSQSRITVEKNVIETTHDASRLRVIFGELTSCKEDSQQRSWMLYEDETIITDYISELISILVIFSN